MWLIFCLQFGMATSTDEKKNLSGSGPRKDGGCDSCPHWSPTTQSCLVVQDGLFLPTTEHIITYCETPYYSSCSYYQQYLQQRHYEEVSNGTWQNRRLHPRVPFRQGFRFSEKKENGTWADIRDDTACTIDLSSGGIRFETRENIQVNTEISFVLDDEGSLVRGFGRIVWAKPIEKSPLFHCGFVFTDSSSPHQAEKLLEPLVS